MTGITRRNVTKGAAWAIPTVTIAAAAPAVAASCSAATAPTVMREASLKHSYQDAGESVNIFTSNGNVAVPQEIVVHAYAVFQTSDLDLQPGDFVVVSSNNGVEIKDIQKSQQPAPTFDADGNPVTDADGNPVPSKTEKRVRTEITIALTKPLDVGESITITDPAYTSDGYYQEYGYEYNGFHAVTTFDAQACQNVVVHMDGGGGSGGQG